MILWVIFSCGNLGLKEINYYKLINGYKDIFIDKEYEEEKYLEGVNLYEIYALYELDRKIRSIFLEYILIVENYIKSLISYNFSEIYGHKDYVLKENFEYYDCPRTNKEKEINFKTEKTVKRLEYLLDNRETDSILHYKSKYGYVPLWVLVNVMTLGNVSKFYSAMKIGDKNRISKEFNLNTKDLEMMIITLNIFRNKCAHEERLYNTKLKLEIPTVKKIHDAYKVDEKYIGKKDLFSLVIILKVMLDKDKFNEFIERLKIAIDLLNDNIKSINIEDILNEMGFSSCWEEIANINL